MSVAVVGALALAVSVQGSPRAGERDKTDGKSGATRLVTGPSAHINDAIAGGAGATIAMVPINPTTIPASSYPAGSSISGSTLTLGGVPARTWWEYRVTGWAPQGLKTAQVRHDSSGQMGSLADCAGGPGGSNLVSFVSNATGGTQPCAVNADCRATISGIASACALGEPSACNGGTCNNGFQNKCDAEWILSGVAGVAAADISTANYRYGAATEPPDVMPDWFPSYMGTQVIEAPAGAKGTYTLNYVVAETFLFDDTAPVALPIPIAALIPGVLKIGCGSCCFGVGGAAPGCVDSLSASECAARAQPAIFTLNGTCLNPPTDDGCCACLTNANCNDGDACTQDLCSNCICSNPNVASWDTATECCDATTGVQTTLGCADQCQADSCSAGGTRGTAICTDTPGEGCDDGNPCTYADTCAGGAGSCAGIDANSVSCVDSADCAAVTGVGYPCEAGSCVCTLTPDLDIEIIDFGGDNCFDDGEKVTAEIVVGASSSPINGGQFLIGYDPSCLDFVSIIGVDPYTNVVYGPVVDETAGTIFFAVGVEFGAGNGDNGGTMVSLSFLKKGECNSCQICPLNNNPQNTYLTDHEGQRITVQPNCSKPIYDKSDLDLTTPGNIKTNVDCDRPTAVESWDAPSATDECGNATVYCRGEHESGVQYSSAVVNTGGELPIGKSSFCCYAVSDGPCGHTVGCPPNTDCADADGNGKPEGCWTVTVNDQTSLDITVGLSPEGGKIPPGTTRCISFTLFANCIQEPLTFSDNVTFGGFGDFIGKSTGKIKIPGSGQWDCITAQDKLHTLRSCFTFAANGSDCVGGQLNASFSGDPRLGGNWLIGGNLDAWKKDDPTANPSLDVIDILDFGTFVSQYLTCYGSGDTACGTTGLGHGGLAGPNADINGDGCADLDDYAFISANFLVSAKQCCCGPQTASAIAVTEISVAQLRADGNADLAVADLNGDGLLNLADMAAFDQGVRPTTKTSVKGGSRSTGSR